MPILYILYEPMPILYIVYEPVEGETFCAALQDRRAAYDQGYPRSDSHVGGKLPALGTNHGSSLFLGRHCGAASSWKGVDRRGVLLIASWASACY
jgi:hypothetical protein